MSPALLDSSTGRGLVQLEAPPGFEPGIEVLQCYRENGELPRQSNILISKQLSLVDGIFGVCLGHLGPYPAEAEVDSALRALVLPAPLFRELFNSEEAIHQFVLDWFARRLSGLMLLVDEVAFRRMDERPARFLLAEARPSPGVSRPILMSHEQIALQLGTAREVVSRLLAQFESEDLVSLGRKQILLVNAPGLKARTGPLHG